MLWLWFIVVFILNIYSLIIWIGRLGIYKHRYTFIHSRLTRTSREEIPRFRFEFKHVSRELGDHVHDMLVRAFITEYLEADGFFFIRMLTVNVSDFVVQEIIEQLWAMYAMKYGENDAKKAEEYYKTYRGDSGTSPPITPMRTSKIDTLPRDPYVPDAKRKYLKQFSDLGTHLLRSTTAVEAMKPTTTTA